jgi:type IV secretory pathway VirB10-like protein
VFSFPLAQDFKQRAQAAIPFPRAAIAAFVSRRLSLRVPPLGAFVSLGAVALGAGLMFANVAHERRAAAIAVAVAPPAIVAPVQAVALAPPKLEPKPDPIAAVATAAPSPEKTTERVDTMPTGAIGEAPKLKAKHKHHPKKAVDANP